MKKLLILLTALSLFSTSSVFAGTSKQNRNDSIISLQYNAFGLHVPTILAAPLAASWYINDSIEFGIQKGQTSPLMQSALEGNTDNVSIDQTGAILRLYWGNSFNFLLSYETLTINGTASETDQTTQVTLSQDFQVELKLGTFGVGNQWLFDNGIVFGVDWAMLSTSLGGTAGLVGSPRVTSDPLGLVGSTDLAALTAQNSKTSEDLESGGKLPGALRIYFGYAF